MMHCGSLMHDDVVDQAEVRRGKTSMAKVSRYPTGQKSRFAFLFACGLLNYWAKTVKLHLAIVLAS